MAARDGGRLFQAGVALHKERKSYVLEAARTLCVALVRHSIVSTEDEAAPGLATACAAAAPAHRESVLLTIVAILEDPVVIRGKKSLSVALGSGGLAAAARKACDDRNPAVRAAAEAALAAMMTRLGQGSKVLAAHATNLKETNPKAWARVEAMQSQSAAAEARASASAEDPRSAVAPSVPGTSSAGVGAAAGTRPSRGSSAPPVQPPRLPGQGSGRGSGAGSGPPPASGAGASTENSIDSASSGSASASLHRATDGAARAGTVPTGRGKPTGPAAKREMESEGGLPPSPEDAVSLFKARAGASVGGILSSSKW